MQISGWTLALQTVNFLVLVWLLSRFLYRPVREVVEKRKQLSEQAFADAERQKKDAEVARQSFEEDRAALVKERQDLLRQLHEGLEAERCKVLDVAREQADELVNKASESIAQERESVLAEIREQVAELAVGLASELLRKSGSGAASRLFLEQLEQQFMELSADERERLQRDLAVEDARLTAVTAFPLTPEEQGQWSDRLALLLGHTDNTDFVTDSEILGGVELRFPHAVFKLTWADQLLAARALLGR